MNSIATKAINTLAKSVLLCLSLTAQAQYNPTGSYQGNTGSASPDWQTSAAGAAAAAFSAASAGMNNAVANAATGANTANAAASYQQNASAQFLQSSAPASSFGQSGTGYTNDGTLMMGGNKIGNPHQILHDLNVPSFFGVDANRLSFSDVPSYGQGTLAQMENHTLTIGVPAGDVVLSRLYLTPTNPYTQGVATPHNNYQTYQGVVADAQAGSYQLTVANDNKLYAFKTLGTMSTQSQNILIKELPAHSVFIANSDPKGGAVAVRVTQNGDYAAMQNYFATVKPYDFSWRSAMGAWADGDVRPDNITAALGQFGNMSIGNNEAGTVFANWVMGSNQVQQYTNDLQTRYQTSGNENFGVLAWDANQNKYVMLDPTNVQAGANSVSGNMPTLGANQFGFFGMHTHPGDSTPSKQDILQTERFGFDQVVIGENGDSAIFAKNPGNQWQNQKFQFENATHDSISRAGYGSSNGSHDPTGIGGVADGRGGQIGGNSGYSSNGGFWSSPVFDLWGFAVVRRVFAQEYGIPVTSEDKLNAYLLLASAYVPNLANYGGLLVSWGTNPNDPNHAIRHLTDAGVDVDATKAAITADLKNRNIAGSPSGGLGIGTVTVNGVDVGYSAYKRPDGSVNVGSIRPGRIR